MKRFVALVFAVTLVTLTGAVVQAHIMVAPDKSKPGVAQDYELRVHNEENVATTSVDLEVPAGFTILSVPAPESGSYKTIKTGDRITSVTWQIAIPPGEYRALKFSAKNPAAPREVHWTVHQHLADGSVVDWSDKPGAKEKAPTSTVTGD